MSKRKDGNETKKKVGAKEEGEDEAKEGPSKEDPLKREKRVLRFQVPVDDVHSEESFTSALSFTSSDEDRDTVPQNASFLRKSLPPPLRHASPRASAGLSPCFHTFVEDLFTEEELIEPSLLQSSSSKQLFEVTKQSPTPSEADINLINSTYLRKLESVKEAIRNGANVNTFRERQTPLLIATEIGDDRLVSYFLTVPQINPDFQNIFGQTPLIIAIVRLLLSHNADVNIPDNMGRTPLHDALFQKRPEMAKLLLAYGADYKMEDCFGEKPMYTSVVTRPCLECLYMLLKLGDSLNYENVTGVSLLSRAILNWTEFHIIKKIVEAGASVNACEQTTGKTPLHFSAITNDLNVAKLLVQEGADVNIKTTYNFTPYDEAIFHKSVDVAEYLVDLTANSNPKLLQTLK